MAIIKATGLMWIPRLGKTVDLGKGDYQTEDEDIIKCAKLNGFEVIADQHEDPKEPEEHREVRRGRPKVVKDEL